MLHLLPLALLALMLGLQISVPASIYASDANAHPPPPLVPSAAPVARGRRESRTLM